MSNLYHYRAICTRVVDGDTLDLDIDLGCHVHVRERVRLFGIDAPETYGVRKDSEEYAAGVLCRDRMTELVTGRELLVNTHKDSKGKYGRYLATVWVVDGDGKVDVAKALVSEGLAVRKDY